MTLTGRTTLVVFVALAILLMATGLLRLNRPLRLVSVALAQVAAIAAAFVVLNQQYVFFASWHDLVGTPPPVGQIMPVSGGREVTGPAGKATVFGSSSERTADGGVLVNETVRGGLSGISAQVLVHLPPGYDSSTRRYPVVELLAGWRGYPQSWVRGLDVLDAIRSVQAQSGGQPFITVIPSVNVALPQDTECTNVPRGAQVETWLTGDVRALVLGQYRALPGGDSWGMMGYSTGGYCAAKLVLHHPDWYRSGVVISGYFNAVRDGDTGDLWGGSQQLRNENDPLWLVTHRPPPPVAILVFTTKQDQESYLSSTKFLSVATTPLQTFSLIAPEGGHNLKTVKNALPSMLIWLSQRLSARGA